MSPGNCYRLTSSSLVQSILDDTFRLRIERTCCLIEQGLRRLHGLLTASDHQKKGTSCSQAPSPTSVLYPKGSLEMNPSAFALTHASLMRANRSSSEAFSHLVPINPCATLPLMVVANRTGSCETKPICPCSHLRLRVLTSIPSSFTEPDRGRYLGEELLAGSVPAGIWHQPLLCIPRYTCM